MIISDQEVSWAYLLGPCFQLQNTKGVPLTGGYIEVYIHGTRDKYYCASDFAGTLHPFQIPLDSLGSNIVLASTEQAYDVYVYNRFGSLIMSRYNVIPVNGTSEGGGGTSNISITSSDGTITVTDTIDPETGIKTYDLSVPWASGDASYWHGRGASNQGQLISDTDTHVLAISEHAIDHEGNDITVGSDGKFHLKEGVYFWTVNVDLYSDSLSNNTQQIYINSNINRASYKMDMTRDNQHSVSFSGITVATQDDFQEGFTIKTEGQTIRAGIYEVAIHKLNPKVLGTKYETGYGIVIEDDTISVDPEVIPSVSTVSGMIQEAVTSIPEYTAGEYIKIEDNEISVTGLQPAGDYLTPEDLNGYATESFVTGYVDQAISEIPEQVQSDWDQTDDTAVDYIKNKPDLDIYATHDEVTSAVTSIDLSDYATHTEVYEATVTAVQVATGAIPDVSDFATHEDLTESAVTSIQLVTGMIPDVSDFITHDEVNTVSGEIVELTTEIVNNVSGDIIETVNNVSSVLHEEIQNIPEQVQSDWNQTDDTQVDYIKNKPDLDIYATHDEINTVSSTIIETVNNVSGEIVETVNNVSSVLHEEMIEIGQAATGAIPDVSDFTTHDEVHESIVTAVEYVTGLIPDVSDYATNSDVFESAVTSIQLVTGLIPTDYATDEELQDAIELVTGKIPELPDEEEVEFEEINLSDYALASAIPDISNLATKAELQDGLELVTGMIPTDYATHDEVFESSVTAIQMVTAIIPEAQVQSDWAETDNTDPSYIQNKPNTTNLVAGDNINIIESSNNLVISCTAIPVVTGFATKEELQDAVEVVTGLIPTDYATDEELQDAIELVTGMIPEAQVQSDWTQNDNTQVDYIKNKPAEYTVVAGQNIGITVDNNDLIISASGTDLTGYVTDEQLQDDLELVTGMIPDVSDFATHAEVNNVSGAIVNEIPDVSDFVTEDQVTALLPEEEEVEFEELDLNNYALASAVPTVQLNSNDQVTAINNHPLAGGGGGGGSYIPGNGIDITNDVISVDNTIATKVELQDGIELVTGMIPEEEEVEFEEIDLSDYALASAIPDVSNLATKAELQDGLELVTGMIPEAQVQSDWTEADSGAVDYIKNKPNEYNVVAGDNIGIMIDNDDLVISASGVDLSDYTTFEDVVAMVSGVTGLTEYGQFYSTNITSAATMNKIKGTIEVTNDGKIKLKKGSSYHVTVRGRYNQTAAANTYGDISYIEYITNQSIHVNVDNTIAEAQYFELSYDLYKLNNDSNYYVYFSMNGGTVNDLFIEIHSLDGAGASSTGPVTGGTEYDAGWGIQILNNVISVNPSIIPVVTGYVTDEELQDSIELVTGLIPEAQVQSDWAVTAVDSPAYIQNKPTEKNLIAGANVTITESNDEVTIETTEIASGLQLVAGPGVTMTVSGTSLIVSANSGMDETLLWSGTYSGSVSDSNYITLSEDPANFEYVMVSNGGGYGATYGSTYTYTGNSTIWSFFQPFAVNDSGVTVVYATRYDVNHTNLRVTAKGIASYNVGSSGIYGYSNNYTMNVGEVQLTKVIGINRIAGGN